MKFENKICHHYSDKEIKRSKLQIITTKNSNQFHRS